MEERPPVDPIAKWMVLIAWILGLIIAVWGFSVLLAKQVNPNTDITSRINNDGIEVSLKRNRMGQYLANGLINNFPVVFLVDTGATSVSIPMHIANKIGLVAQGQGAARTANGTVVVNFTKIDQLRLGDIVLSDVDATMNPGMQDDFVLLGMSALQRLEFTQSKNQLFLRWAKPN